MLVWDDPEPIGVWLRGYNIRLLPRTFAAIGWVSGGELKGAVAFWDVNGVNCQAAIAVSGGRMPPGLLRAGLFYAFKQLTLRRMTFMVECDNLRSQAFVEGLGAEKEGLLKVASAASKDVVIYGLFADKCKIWSRWNERARRPGKS
jgi:hypothetical protein